MNLKELPNEEKPRERLIKYGKENISNNELIEIILKSGTKSIGLKEISHNILSSVNNKSTLSRFNTFCFERLPILLESIMAITFSER